MILLSFKFKIYTPADLFRFVRLKLCSPSRNEIVEHIEAHNGEIKYVVFNILEELTEKDARTGELLYAKEKFNDKLDEITKLTKSLIFKSLYK